MRVRSAVALPVVTAVAFLALTACGSADPADVSQLAATMTATSNPAGVGLTKAQASCQAKIYLESDLSATARKTLQKTGRLTAADKDDRDELVKIADRIMRDCN